jgi:hypothetical protein
VNDGLENTMKEMTVAYLSQQSLGGSSKENHTTPQSGNQSRG